MICSNEKGYPIYGGSGAGLLSNGSGFIWSWLPARCFVDGGRGGTNIRYGGDGGFGGGGDGGYGYVQGGGGYTGGGVWANSTNGIAGDGGSVNHGFDKQSGYGAGLEIMADQRSMIGRKLFLIGEEATLPFILIGKKYI
jgi:hypothetical protein